MKLLIIAGSLALLAGCSSMRHHGGDMAGASGMSQSGGMHSGAGASTGPDSQNQAEHRQGEIFNSYAD